MEYYFPGSEMNKRIAIVEYTHEVQCTESHTCVNPSMAEIVSVPLGYVDWRCRFRIVEIFCGGSKNPAQTGDVQGFYMFLCEEISIQWIVWIFIGKNAALHQDWGEFGSVSSLTHHWNPMSAHQPKLHDAIGHNEECHKGFHIPLGGRRYCWAANVVGTYLVKWKGKFFNNRECFFWKHHTWHMILWGLTGLWREFPGLHTAAL